MPDLVTSMLTLGSGAIVGVVLGLVGGGGSILAVPLLVYIVGVKSPHMAIGTSAVAVAASAAGNLFSHWKSGNVKWGCAVLFAAAGVIGAFGGSTAAKAVDGQRLLALFGLVMIVVGLLMLRRRSSEGDPEVKLTRESAGRLAPLLITVGFTVGLFSGFFGIGGGFLIVPGLMLATGMPLSSAIGTSLFAVSAFGAATAASYAAPGFINWPMAGLFVIGGLAGGVIGVRIGKILGAQKRALTLVFASLVIVVGAYVVAKGFWPQAATA
jgi:uncharacterized membrane protein YfcA